MENKKIYLIREYGGQWEDSWERIAYAFLDEESRTKKLNELRKHNSKMESHRLLWDEITEILDKADHPEYDKFFMEDYDFNKEIPDEFENYLYSDSFERFIYWMNKCLPITYQKYSEDFWKDLYYYFEVQNKQYGEFYSSYYDTLEIDITDEKEFDIIRKN